MSRIYTNHRIALKQLTSAKENIKRATECLEGLFAYDLLPALGYLQEHLEIRIEQEKALIDGEEEE